ncbi:MAG: thymidine phosphorylase [bacterium]
MNPIDIITKKRDGGSLSHNELDYLVNGYVREDIPDYQLSAFLMSVYFRGMVPEEIASFTQIMRDSGTVLDLADISGFKVDKHSTGGVGDKVSLILAPLAASAGLVVPMMSGRALAHTGGTLDKLEAIPGFRTNLSIPEFMAQLEKIGVALIGQTGDLCPADKKIYALRDATATVNAIPLITASILSKKMAEGVDALVLDVKAGSGAIFEDKENAWDLAWMLVKTAEHFNLKTTAILTSMQQPLGNFVGNWLETREAIETLQGNGPDDLLDVTLALSAHMLMQAKMFQTLSEAKAKLKQLLDSGEALEKFEQIVAAQGGDLSVIAEPATYPRSKYHSEIKSPHSGYISAIHCREIGKISMALGAGRSAVSDSVDFTSGIHLQKKIGHHVEKGETLAVAFSNNQDTLTQYETRLQAAFQIGENETRPEPLILGTVDVSGESDVTIPSK